MSMRASLLPFNWFVLVLLVWKTKPPIKRLWQESVSGNWFWLTTKAHAMSVKIGRWAWPRLKCHSYSKEIDELESKWQCFEAAARSGDRTRDGRTAGTQKQTRNQSAAEGSSLKMKARKAWTERHRENGKLEHTAAESNRIRAWWQDIVNKAKFAVMYKSGHDYF